MTSVSDSATAAAGDNLAAIRHVARDFLKKEWSNAQFRAFADAPGGAAEALWEKIAPLGWPGVVIPESFGGVEGTFAELGVLAEELGRAIAAVPLVPSLVAANTVLMSGNVSLAERILPGVAVGDDLLSL